MLEYNLNQPKNMRCNISGFTIKYVDNGTSFKIIESTLQPNREYTVAVENYLAERATRFLGQEIEYTALEKNTHQAMIEWFVENKNIKGISKKIKKAN
jgi:hypothetical protein